MVRHIQRTAGPRVEGKMRGYRVLIHTKTDHGEDRLDVVAREGGPAALTYRKSADGTISATFMGEEQQNRGVNDLSERLRNEVHLKVRGEMITLCATAFRATGRALYLLCSMPPEGYSSVAYHQRTAEEDAKASPGKMVEQALTDETERIIRENVRGAVIDLKNTRIRTLPMTIAATPEYVTAVVTQDMTDPKTGGMAEMLFQKGYQGRPKQRSPMEYNTVWLSSRAFSELEATDRELLKFYCRSIAATQTDPVRMKHPGQIVQAIKDHLGLTKAEWRVFQKVGPESFGTRADPARNGPAEEARGYREKVRISCRAIAQANRPEADIAKVRKIADMSAPHMFYQNAHWDQGDPWRAWVNVLNSFLGHIGDQQATRLRYIEDALRSTVTQGQPWGPGNWRTLVARAEAWHRQIRRQEIRWEEDDTPWESALGPTVIGPVAFEPVLRPNDLIRLGADMENCLGTYVNRCKYGETRIFLAKLDGKEHAALELTKVGHQWQPGQIDGYMRTPPKGEVREAARELAKRYSEAWAENEPGHHGPGQHRGGQHDPEE